MPYDIITIGSATRDVFLVSKEFKLFPSEKFVTGVGECVALGTKIDLDHLILSVGGGATNAAATFGNLGFKTATVARVGQDCHGSEVLADLKQNHVSTALLRVVKDGVTAYSTLLTELKGGERTVLVYRGVSSTFRDDDLPWSELKSEWMYLTSLSGNMDVAKKLITQLGSTTLRHGSGPSAKIIWNPGQGEIKKGRKAFERLFPHLFALILNLEEAQQLFGKEIRIPSSLLLVITDGARGAHASLNGTTWFVKAQAKKVISRTGAGDAFGSGLTAGLIKGWGVDDALRLALINSQSVIQHYGAHVGVLKKWPTKKELQKIVVAQV